MAKRTKTIRRSKARKFKGPLLAALALFMGVLAGCGGPSTVELALAFEPGKSYQIVEESDMVTDLGGVASLQEHAEIRRTLTINSVAPDGSAKASLSIDQVRHDLIGLPPGMKMPLSQIVEAGEGLVYSLEITPTGQFSNVQPPGNIHALVRENLPDFPEVGADVLNNIIENSYGPNAIGKNLEMAVAIYPEEPVDVGSTWTKNRDWNYGGTPTKVNQTFTVTGRNNGIMTIEVVSEVSAIGDGSGGTITETFTVNETSGWIQSSTAKYDMSGSWPVMGQTFTAKTSGRSELNIY